MLKPLTIEPKKKKVLSEILNRPKTYGEYYGDPSLNTFDNILDKGGFKNDKDYEDFKCYTCKLTSKKSRIITQAYWLGYNNNWPKLKELLSSLRSSRKSKLAKMAQYAARAGAFQSAEDD